ncbi:hypothetical protein, partial [Klebsiella pneumoniae]|uniref:hypothetical protein n=1 Tax=Klebsiella pneumoniae TaxID=573 RepID=UPI0024DE3C2D
RDEPFIITIGVKWKMAFNKKKWKVAFNKKKVEGGLQQKKVEGGLQQKKKWKVAVMYAAEAS